MSGIPYDFFATLEDTALREYDRQAAEGKLGPDYQLLLVHGGECRKLPGAARTESLGTRASGKPVAKERHRQYAHRGKTRHGSPALELVARQGLATLRELDLVCFQESALDSLPECAVLLEFDFTLEKPLITRDDEPFYPIDNPVRKDRLFRTPMVSGSSWKGALRAAAVENLFLREQSAEELRAERQALREIFGDEKVVDEGWDPQTGDPPDPRVHALRGFLDHYLHDSEIPESGDDLRRRGRLHCLPSYFEAIDVEVINPRDRRTRAGTQPIEFETVPAGSTARMSLFYFAFCVEEPDGLDAAMARDWRLIGEALYRMLRLSGFGAKKTSGHGLAGPTIKNLRLQSWGPLGRCASEASIEELLSLDRPEEVVR